MFRLPENQFRACLAAANSRDTLIVASLDPFLENSSQLVRLGAVFALGQLPSNISNEKLIARLKAENIVEVRNQIMLSLGQIGDQKTISLLNRQWRSEIPDDVFMRACVYFFSRGIILPENITECCNLLNSDNMNTRRMAAVALQRIQATEHLLPHIGALMQAAKSPDREIRRSVARIMRSMTFAKKNLVYKTLLADEDWGVRYESVLTIPTLEQPEDLWMFALSDSNNHVVAAALQNAPENIPLSPRLINILTNLFNQSSEHIKGSIARFVTSRIDSSTQNIEGIIQSQENLLVYRAEGLGKLQTRKSYEALVLLAEHKTFSVASAAYMELINMLNPLLDNKTITSEEYLSVLRHGLTGNDPVQIYLAANIMTESTVDVGGLLPDLYACLKKQNDFKFCEALLTVLRVIEKLHPNDAPDHIRPLLTNRQEQLRNESRRILGEAYRLTLAPSLEYTDPFLYSNLDKLNQHGLHPHVEITTNKGSFVIRCDGYYVPYTTAAFLDRIDSGFYCGLIFHRVVPNFVVQGGDPRGDGWGGPNYHLLTEKSPIGYNTGSVGMASSGPDTEGSQFFITTTPQYHLDYNYTRFGEIVKGLNVVSKIERGDQILSARILRSSN